MMLKDASRHPRRCMNAKTKKRSGISKAIDIFTILSNMMDENSSSEENVISVENKRAEYSDDDDSIDEFAKALELIEENADQLDVELSEAINEVKS